MDNITPLAIRNHLMSNQLIVALNNVQLDSVLDGAFVVIVTNFHDVDVEK